MIYIVLIGMIWFWVHAQIHHGLASRLLSSLVLFTLTILIVRSIYGISHFYSRAPIAQTLRNMNYDRAANQREDYNKMIEYYQFHNERVSYLLEETARLKKKYENVSQVEQPGAAQPATKPADKPSAKDQPSTPTSKDAPR